MQNRMQRKLKNKLYTDLSSQCVTVDRRLLSEEKLAGGSGLSKIVDDVDEICL